MAKSLWGKVYYQDTFAGFIKQDPGGRCDFTYDISYLDTEFPPIAYTLPKREAPFINERGLHPFFDNLVAEGWLQEAQARALNLNLNDRFGLLLGFGYDLAGAVSVIDPEPIPHQMINHGEKIVNAAIQGRASLSGVQSKMMVVKEGKDFRAVKGDELSTHIAKFPREKFPDILEVEYLTTLAAQRLLPDDKVVELEMGSICQKEALIITRFDRTSSGKRIHFEEFNQLLGHYSGDDKYKGAYEDMGEFINNASSCLPIDADKLYRRILVCLLLGNTDAHFKNFAMFHTREGLRLTESYDLVSAARYDQFNTIALGIGKTNELKIGDLKAKHIVDMSQGFFLNDRAVQSTVLDLKNRLELAKEAIVKSEVGAKWLKKKLIDIMEKRWKGSFDSIGTLLLKRQNRGGKGQVLLKKD